MFLKSFLKIPNRVRKKTFSNSTGPYITPILIHQLASGHLYLLPPSYLISLPPIPITPHLTSSVCHPPPLPTSYLISLPPIPINSILPQSPDQEYTSRSLHCLPCLRVPCQESLKKKHIALQVKLQKIFNTKTTIANNG